MMKHVFIDTNIWLSLYHFTNDDLSQFAKLKEMIGKSINLIVPKQVFDEIMRNREAKILDAQKSFDLKRPQYPAFCKGYEEFEQLSKDIANLCKQFMAFKKKIEDDVMNQDLPADKTLKSFFSSVELLPCDDYIGKAYNRYRIGNPPGKDNKYGDAINWECILDVVPEGEDLYFISADKDYRSLVSDNEMNPFLVHEWEERKKSKVYFFCSLVSFLNEHVKEIQLKAESEKEQLIKKLSYSCDFYTTHKVISKLNQYSSWTEKQIDLLCSALEDNFQVLWILEDPDVFNFYSSILSNLKYDTLEDCATKRAMDRITEIVEKNRKKCEEDYEADKYDAFEEYSNH